MDHRPPDPRINAYRADLADARLEGRVEAARFAEGWAGQVRVAVAHVLGAPDAGEALTTQLLFGETVRVFEEHEGWAWVQADADGYVGYVPAAAISRTVGAPTHKIAALSTPAMARPDVKSPPLVDLAFGARVTVVREDSGFAALAIGAFIPLPHLIAIDARETDFVAVAERFLGTPYLWGGRTRAGLDCSGLLQTALRATGVSAPRDTDMQQAALGMPIIHSPSLEGLQRGDLVFWPRHVGIMTDATHLLHANGFHMSVIVEPLVKTVARIKAIGSKVVAVKRL
ncbi:MAG: NlpC/P60 family protein [Hyphomicrobiaceae bacterium]